MRKKMIAIVILLTVTGKLAWSPWLTQDAASNLAETQFNQAWNGIIDGCGTGVPIWVQRNIVKYRLAQL